MLEGFGFAAAEQDAVLITIDKLDKIGQDGVVAELRERGVTAGGRRRARGVPPPPDDDGVPPVRRAAIRKALPPDPDAAVVADLAAIGEAVGAERLQLRPVPGARHGLLHRHDLRARAPERRLLARRRRPLRRHDRALPRSEVPARASRSASSASSTSSTLPDDAAGARSSWSTTPTCRWRPCSSSRRR